MITFEDITKDLFTDKEYEIFNNISVNTVDLNELEKHGKVDINETLDDENLLITQKIEFTSYDGSVQFTKTKLYYKHRAEYERIKELNDLIAFAIKTEDYEKAQYFKKEREQLLINQI